MGESAENCKEDTPPIFILLPICFEAKTDLFFNVLRNVVSRGRTQDNLLENALISGMTGEKFRIDSNDLSVDWATLTSVAEQIWQSKLLGCWATRHFPSIGKKLIGAAWQPPKRWDVKVIGSTEMTEEEINTIIFKKMKLRIIELNVSVSTQVAKLKYFVRAPATIGKINVTIISPKMRAFDIEDEYLEDCWKALKVGEFLSTVNFKQQVNSISTFKPPQPSIVTSHLAIERHRINRKDNDAVVSLDEAPIEKSNTAPSNPTRSSNAMTSPLSSQYKSIPPCNVVLTDFIQRTAKINVASEPTINPAAKRARLDDSPNGDSNFDALQVAVFEMRKDIQNITKWFDLDAADDNEATNGPERLHLAVFKQKDTEISKLRASLQSVREENELLKAVKTQLHSENAAKSDLISALQKGVEATSKLLEKSQEESNVLAQKLCALDQIIIELTDTNRILQVEINTAKSLNSNMEPNSQIQILNDKIGTLQEDLNAVETRSASIESNFQSQIQNLTKQLHDADDKEIEWTDTIRKLREELSAAKRRSASIESNFQSQIQNLAKQLHEADDKKIESTDTIQELREELNSVKIKLEENDKLEQTLNDTKLRFNNLLCELQVQLDNSEKTSEETENKNAELAGKNERLQGELDAAENRHASIELNFQSQIQGFQAQNQNLIEQLSEANNMKIESTDTIRKLREELNSAKIKLEENDKLMETLNDTKIRFNNLLGELQVQLENSEKTSAETEKINAELTGKNEKLQGELDALKQDAANKDREVSSPKSTLENRHDSNIHTDLMTTPEIRDGNNEVEAKKENTSNEEQETSAEPKLNRHLLKIRRHLVKCQFGWIKFYGKKDFRRPGFVQPTDEDGITRAQKVTMNGSVSDIKYKFCSFSENIPDIEKEESQIKALNNLNNRYKFNFK